MPDATVPVHTASETSTRQVMQRSLSLYGPHAPQWMQYPSIVESRLRAGGWRSAFSRGAEGLVLVPDAIIASDTEAARLGLCEISPCGHKALTIDTLDNNRAVVVTMAEAKMFWDFQRRVPKPPSESTADPLLI